ncbi:MAG: LLM class F420-dependent oxidoreductase [Myxococcota bacterium]|jgi:F420-dependent oxidoreductase-like protein
MKLGLALSAFGAKLKLPVEQVRHAERLGFDSVWTAEAYGADALTPLAFLAAHTKRIRLGAGVLQLAARPPAAAAMAVSSLEALAGRGRVIVGLGASGPQIVEGWYGQPWGRPLHALRDYVAILRKIFAREGPVIHEGLAISLPYAGADATGMGKPLKSILHTNPAMPIWCGTGSRAMVELTAEIADGWLPFGFVPGSLDVYRPWLEEGFRRAGGGKSFKNFEIQASVALEVTDDIEGALERRRPQAALLVGGMGHPKLNFHKKRMIRAGFGDAAERIQELFLAGAREEAIKAVPLEFIDAGALIGPLARIEERFHAWRDSGVTGLSVQTDDQEAMQLVARLADTIP